jgi:hypothetical protein
MQRQNVVRPSATRATRDTPEDVMRCRRSSPSSRQPAGVVAASRTRRPALRDQAHLSSSAVAVRARAREEGHRADHEPRAGGRDVRRCYRKGARSEEQERALEPHERGDDAADEASGRPRLRAS